MNATNSPDVSVTHEVRDACLCLHVQRAARVLARRFDDAFRPLGLSQGQFSLLMAANVPEAPPLGRLAALLAMDRTTLTAILKPLARRGLITVDVDARDRRGRRVALTRTGRALLGEAVPIWRAVHGELEVRHLAGAADALRAGLNELTFGTPERA